MPPDFRVSIIDCSKAHRIHNLVMSIITDPKEKLNLGTAISLADEISSTGALAVYVVLSATYERLFRRKGLYVTLELIEFCVRNFGLFFAKFLNKVYLEGMTRLLKIKSMDEQCIFGQVQSSLKSLMSSKKKKFTVTSHGLALSSDVLLNRCQRKVLFLLQLWADAYMMHEDVVPDILKIYRKLRQKGYPFPPRDSQQRFLIKHAEKSPAFMGDNVTLRDTAFPTKNIDEETDNLVSSNDATLPSGSNLLTDHVRHEIIKAIIMYRTSQKDEEKEASTRICEKYYPLIMSKLKGTSNSCLSERDELLELKAEISNILPNIDVYQETDTSTLNSGIQDIPFVTSQNSGNTIPELRDRDPVQSNPLSFTDPSIFPEIIPFKTNSTTGTICFENTVSKEEEEEEETRIPKLSYPPRASHNVKREIAPSESEAAVYDLLGDYEPENSNPLL